MPVMARTPLGGLGANLLDDPTWPNRRGTRLLISRCCAGVDVLSGH